MEKLVQVFMSLGESESRTRVGYRNLGNPDFESRY